MYLVKGFAIIPYEDPQVKVFYTKHLAQLFVKLFLSYIKEGFVTIEKSE